MDQTLPLTKKEKRELRKLEKREERTKEAKTRLLQKLFLWSSGLLFLVGAFFLVKKSASVSPNVPDLNLTTVASSDWAKGKENAKHLLVEYSDFQCPACAGYAPVVKQLLQEKGDQFTFAYRHFPLPQHTNADEAARASEAAGKQGTFWEMHDLLFDRQESWSENSNPDETFALYAQELGLNSQQFVNDYNSDEVKNKVQTDYTSGVAAGVNSTPSFFFDGKKIQPGSYKDFTALFE